MSLGPWISLPGSTIASPFGPRAVRTVLPRHQTLRAAMDWSYDLLPEAEQTILRR
jgi:hypothetical protein